MAHFLEVAYRVLSEAKRPLSPKEIVNLGSKRGWLVTGGKTPWQSMKARLSTDILDKKEKSQFMRTSAGKFGLRSWEGQEQEYRSPRFKKSLLDEDIVVFLASSLSKYIGGRGLHTTPLENRKQLIDELRPMRRRKAERDFSVIQLVSAFIVRFQGKYLTYKRTKRLPEERLHGFYSVPFGGHLNPDDLLPLFDIFDPKIAHVLLTRELREEVILEKNRMPEIKYKGLLYDNTREISRQHLGIVYDVYFDSPKYTIGERGFLMDPKFETLDEINFPRPYGRGFNLSQTSFALHLFYLVPLCTVG
jgi:predicted NUDIX family phosphoesterase